MPNSLNLAEISRPTVLLDEEKARRNIQRMVEKARRSQVALRPHFKTHISTGVGEWFRDQGVGQITVTCLEMAAYFAAAGWGDITIAFPLNLRELDALNALAGQISLHLVVDSLASAQALRRRLTNPVHAWLAVDAGYGREGTPWDAPEQAGQIVSELQRAPGLVFEGLITHAGHSYEARGAEAVRKVYQDTFQNVLSLKSNLAGRAGSELRISVGDTPGCSLVEDLGGVTEIRPGNFVFFDLVQEEIGACREEDIAVVTACPVVAVYPQRGTLAIYGGAVHLSKDFIPQATGRCYGRAAWLGVDGWGSALPGADVFSLSQEIGLVRLTPELEKQVKVGDLLAIYPPHSCLLVNCMRRYRTLTNQVIECMPL